MIYLYPCLCRAFVPVYLSICLSISVGRYGNVLLHFVFVLAVALWFFVRWFLCVRVLSSVYRAFEPVGEIVVCLIISIMGMSRHDRDAERNSFHRV